MPEAVLERAQAELFELPGAGMSILEMSHRSKTFEDILGRTQADLKELLGLPDNYHVLFVQGGASLQFSMVPLNLLADGKNADYILTGSWSQKARQEARKVGTANVAASTKEENFRRIPRQEELRLDPAAEYVHITTNNTIFGTQWAKEPETGAVPLVADASSDILSRPIDVEKYGVIYAGTQKNMGPAGVTLVVLRKDMVRPVADDLPIMLDYKTHIENNSLYNTPNTFGIYMVGLVCQWLKSLGGLAAMQRLNEEKAALLYGAIDATEFYRGHAAPDSRSRMNVTFLLPNEDLEKRFAEEATAEGMVELKGHRSVGGLRASIYNAFPRAGVEALVQFMQEFERKNG